MPVSSYDSDDGLGVGARAEHARLDPDLSPYRRAWVLHAFATVRGYHHHRLRFDRLGLGPQGRLRVTAHLAWRQWQNDGYWGIGNGTVRERGQSESDLAALDEDDPARKRNRYALLQPFVQLSLRQQVGAHSPWFVYGAFNPKYSVVRTYEGSLLAQQRPYGTEGGFVPQVLFGVQRDSRDPEVAPTRGALLELGGRVGPAVHGEAGGYAGAMAAARGFQALGTPRLVLAGRVMAEALWGRVPFYEMVQGGGLAPVQGLGGYETLRGLRYGRFRAPGKAFANLELRARPWEGSVKGTALAAELTPFVDVGAVFFAGDQATAPPPGRPLHPGLGLGGRLVMDETFVGRVDVGWARDPVEAADGRVVEETTLGVYVVFDHPF